MSTLKVNALNNGGSAIDLPNSFKLGGNPIEQGYTSSATEPTSPSTGDLWWDSANETLYQYLNGEFKELTLVAPGITWGGDRGLFAGKVYGTDIDYVDITTTGNATDFGDLANNAPFFGSASDSTYGVMGGGQWSSMSYYSNVIQYVTISTTGNASDFGDLTRGVRRLAACGDGTYGVFSGGETSGNVKDNVMEYITIQTTGNSSDFGDMLAGIMNSGACGNATYGVFAGGYNTTFSNVIEYVTIATPGNSQDFGDLTSARNNWAGLSDKTRGLFAGGGANVIDYITVSTPGNASDFGDAISLNAGYENVGMMSCANNTRGVWGGGTANGDYNTIQYVTIQTLGNAADFGDLTSARYNQNGGLSGSPS